MNQLFNFIVNFSIGYMASIFQVREIAPGSHFFFFERWERGINSIIIDNNGISLPRPVTHDQAVPLLKPLSSLVIKPKEARMIASL